jgi:polyisoprenyl-teichoic acid--peptidoglycan teichoic acid transferase
MLEDHTRPGLWKRLLIGAALVVFASAGATAVAAFREVDRVVNALRVQPELKLGTELAQTDPGKPQTLMLLGSDRRPKNNAEGAAPGARSDTIILVRLDPSKKATAMMSLPRDLKVQIPGRGTDKINAAYEKGGPRLTLKTVKALTGLRINHVINVDFRGFWAATDAIGCVYADIDRRYFNNTPGFAYINVPQGYQRMCGRKALQYVRFRHEDNDLVRSARQQDFIRQAKQQVGVGELIDDRDKLVRIFGRYATSDIRSRAEVLRLLKLAVFSVDQPIREVHFEGTIGPSYVTASSAKLQQLAQDFLGVEESRGPRGVLKPKGKRKRTRGGANLERADALGKDQAVQAVQQGAGGRLPVYYPTARTRASVFVGPPRVYTIRDLDGRKRGAYRMVIKRPLVGEYYGLQGTTWRRPPILEGASEKRRIGKRTFELHYDGDRLRLVAWRTRKAVYWVSNSLLLTLSERQMLAIARSSRLL